VWVSNSHSVYIDLAVQVDVEDAVGVAHQIEKIVSKVEDEL